MVMAYHCTPSFHFGCRNRHESLRFGHASFRSLVRRSGTKRRTDPPLAIPVVLVVATHTYPSSSIVDNGTDKSIVLDQKCICYSRKRRRSTVPRLCATPPSRAAGKRSTGNLLVWRLLLPTGMPTKAFRRPFQEMCWLGGRRRTSLVSI